MHRVSGRTCTWSHVSSLSVNLRQNHKFSQVPSPAVNAVTWAERLNAWYTVDFTLAQGLMVATKQTQPLSYPTTSLTFSESQIFQEIWWILGILSPGRGLVGSSGYNLWMEYAYQLYFLVPATRIKLKVFESFEEGSLIQFWVPPTWREEIYFHCLLAPQVSKCESANILSTVESHKTLKGSSRQVIYSWFLSWEMRWEMQGSSFWLIHSILCFVNNATLIQSQSRPKEYVSSLRKRGSAHILSCSLVSNISSISGCWDKENMNEGYSHITP